MKHVKRDLRKLRDDLARAGQEYREQGGKTHEQFWEGTDESARKVGSKESSAARAKKGSPKRRPSASVA